MLAVKTACIFRHLIITSRCLDEMSTLQKKSCFRTTRQSLSFWYHHFITAINFLILGDSSLPKEFDCEGQWDDWNCLIQIAPIWTCWDLYPSEWCLKTKLYIFGICWIYFWSCRFWCNWSGKCPISIINFIFHTYCLRKVNLKWMPGLW